MCEIPPEKLAERSEYLNSLNGYNITIPYKVDIIKYLDGLDESASSGTGQLSVLGYIPTGLAFISRSNSMRRSPTRYGTERPAAMKTWKK